jgi:hypothetical protein
MGAMVVMGAMVSTRAVPAPGSGTLRSGVHLSS